MVANYFSQALLTNPKASDDINNIIDSCFITTFIQDSQESHRDLLDHAKRLEATLEDIAIEYEDKAVPILHDNLLVFQGERKEAEEDPERASYIDDPVYEIPEARGHPPRPPLDPGKVSRLVSKLVILYPTTTTLVYSYLIY